MKRVSGWSSTRFSIALMTRISPDNIYDVVYQKNQYSGIQPPRIERCWVKDELVQLVREELENRTDYDVIFFRTERYSDYGVPMFQVEHHYFSSYD